MEDHGVFRSSDVGDLFYLISMDRKTFLLAYNAKMFEYCESNEGNNKYPPAKPGVFHRRAKPYVSSPRVTSRKYGLPAARILLPATRKRVRNSPWSVVLLLCPRLIVDECTPGSSSHSFPPYLRNTLDTKIRGSCTCTAVPATSRRSLDYSFPLGIP